MKVDYGCDLHGRIGDPRTGYDPEAMRRLTERQYAMVSKTTKQGSVDLDVIVLAVDRGEAVLQPAGDTSELFGSEQMILDCFLSFTHQGRPVALRGYLLHDEPPTIRFGVGDGVVLRQRRTHARLDVVLPAQIRVPGAAEPLPATTRDISAGGLAVDCPGKPAGERFEVAVELPTGLRVDASCHVRSRRGSVLALEWDGLDPETVAAISAYVLDAKRELASPDDESEDEQLAA